MRKDVIRVVNNIVNEIVGGYYNSMLDDNKEDFTKFTKENFVNEFVDLIYLESTREEGNIKFEGKDNIKQHILIKLATDNDFKEIMDYVRG